MITGMHYMGACMVSEYSKAKFEVKTYNLWSTETIYHTMRFHNNIFKHIFMRLEEMNEHHSL